jgi:hypothetical protein
VSFQAERQQKEAQRRSGCLQSLSHEPKEHSSVSWKRNERQLQAETKMVRQQLTREKAARSSGHSAEEPPVEVSVSPLLRRQRERRAQAETKTRQVQHVERPSRVLRSVWLRLVSLWSSLESERQGQAERQPVVSESSGRSLSEER